ncbi:putative histone deacetylase [Diplodia seriata]|uniref:histone deacetylase n=1 Tax=Diplodia seriata TaxID=420778 RepID=A0A0G2HA06_9PEZI|nr:putative histone deacetylase [Diplodia seriata]
MIESESDDSSDDATTARYPQRAMVVINAPKPKSETLPYSSSRSGLVYDVRMRFHTEPLDAMLSEDDIHPEDPRRIMEIFNELAEAGLVETPSHHVTEPDFSLWRINARPATEEEVCLVHTRDHYLQVRAYQVIRPPGHHAEHNAPGGFCFFNNVSVAARVCQQDFPDKCRKILILDWDVHHGNGVQRAFYNDPNVLYISIHVHMNGTFYPSNNYGDHTHCGEGPGEGKNVNIPWSSQGMGDGDYMMTELFILRDKISKSFEKQVLATHNFAEERPLLVIFHEPPETTALPDPRSTKISLHNIFVTDVTKTYVEWAVKNGFGVIDVNIPEHITDPNGVPEFADADPDDLRGFLTRELATYLWENYISLGENTHKFFMGVGAAYGGILDLLGENDDCTKETDHTFAFIAENSLQSIKKLTDDYIGDWYYNSSHIYVAQNHAAWDPARQRKLRKKYGYVVRSPHDDLSNMLEEHRDEVTDIMLQLTEEWREEQAEAAKLRAAEEAQNPAKRHQSNSAAFLQNSTIYDSNGTSGPTSNSSGPTSAAGSNSMTDGNGNRGGGRGIRHTSLPAPAVDPRSTPMIRSPSGHGAHPRGPPLGNFTITPTRRAGSGSVSPGKRTRGE